MANFLDQAGGLWARGALHGKVGGAFTSSATQHGGQETTLFSIITNLLHFGMVVVGLDYGHAGQMTLDEITGGSPYGATTITGGDGSRLPTANELEGAPTRVTRSPRLQTSCTAEIGNPGSTRDAKRRRAMSCSISALLIRNLHDVFGENDPKHRRAAIGEIYTEDCVFYDPSRGVHRGRDEIDRVAGTIRATHPDFRYQPIAKPEQLGDGGRVQWVSGRPGEAPAYAGTDFIITRDGRIAALYLFFDKLP